MGKPESCAEAALEELCLEYGYCLPADERDRLLREPPSSAEALADAVLAAEGLDPLTLDRHARDQVIEVIRDWLFDDGNGRAAKSGLPRML